MPIDCFFAIHMPYCLERLSNGTYVVLNRRYKPLGFNTKTHIDYEAYPIGASLRIMLQTAQKLSHSGSSNREKIYLYGDGCIPTESAENMELYLKKLKKLSHLKVGFPVEKIKAWPANNRRKQDA